ncbi:hypothetical protein D3874_04830 [Oleomonas cavernae]|uniref:Recombinase domain-containing protein n=1 Tax=Oleomonas cavernae TaxID=2320859 RepID=A0A418W926_9PROT|nr:recombinase family protein [Oleomonas cavernae]RJF86434.1 hypothetical protein D3874_04830 [Oleomonas cavernae]
MTTDSTRYAQDKVLGLVGSVRRGDGCAYGYWLSGPAADGRRFSKPRKVVLTGEADVVRRIFQEYASGRSLRQIVHRFNLEGLPAPRGGLWSAAMLLGSGSRGTGLLRNKLYIGQIVTNKQRYYRDPTTGRRRTRPNPADAWIVEEAPDLRIIDQDLWNAVQARLAITSQRRPDSSGSAVTGPSRAMRKASLIEGRVRCGLCDGAMSIGATGDRLVCLNFRERGTCSNNRTVSQDHLQGRTIRELELIIERVTEIHRMDHRFSIEGATPETGNTRNAELRRQLISTGKPPSVSEDLHSLLQAAENLVAELKTAWLEFQKLKAPCSANVEEVLPFYATVLADFDECLTAAGSTEPAQLVLSRLVDTISIFPRPGRGAYTLQLLGPINLLLAR